MSKENHAYVTFEWQSGRENYCLKESDMRRIVGKFLWQLAVHNIPKGERKK